MTVTEVNDVLGTLERIVALLAPGILAWIAWQQRKAQQAVARVKTDLAAADLKSDAHRNALAAALGAVAAQVEEVHAATNGMKAELVEEVRKASYAKGVKEEKDRGGAEAGGDFRGGPGAGPAGGAAPAGPR